MYKHIRDVTALSGDGGGGIAPYSRKYWWELNLVVGSQITIANVLADLNLAVRYGITIRIYVSKKFWRILIWWLLRLSANLPNLIPRQIFRLYGTHSVHAQKVIKPDL